MKKRLLSILMALALCLGLLPTAALAASNPDSYVFDISEGRVTIVNGIEPGKIAVKYGSDKKMDNIDPSQVITVTSSTTDYELHVNTATPVTIKASNLSINRSGTEFAYAMSLDASGANVKLILEGTNYFVGGDQTPGISVGEGKTLTIEGNGSLEAESTPRGLGVESVGIGGDVERNCGTIIINSGTVTVASIGSTPGIGAGSSGYSGGTLIVTGGTVNASDNADAGIKPDAVDNNNLAVFGNLMLPVDLTIPEGKTLTIPSGASLTIPEGVTLTIPEGVTLTVAEGGTLTNNGTIINFGTIIGTVSGNQPKTIAAMYLDETGEEQMAFCDAAITADNLLTDLGEAGKTTWYVVQGDVAFGTGERLTRESIPRAMSA